MLVRMRWEGLGVVNLQLQNNALLLRWLWRMYANEKKLWASYATMIYAIKPTRDGPLFLGATGSFFWRTLLKLRPIFAWSAKFHISSARTTSFWFDSWFGQPLALPTQRHLPHRYISVREAISKRDQLFPRPLTLHHSQVIQHLSNLVLDRGVDEIKWTLSVSGSFSVKSTYDRLSQAGKIKSATMDIWRAAITPSIRLFFYLLLKKRILTHDVMAKRNIAYIPGCVMCNGQHQEDARHLFFTCTYANSIWIALSDLLSTNLVMSDSIQFIYLDSVPKGRENGRSWTTVFVTALWFIWRERNERTFRAKRVPAPILVNKIRTEVQLCLKHC